MLTKGEREALALCVGGLRPSVMAAEREATLARLWHYVELQREPIWKSKNELNLRQPHAKSTQFPRSLRLAGWLAGGRSCRHQLPPRPVWAFPTEILKVSATLPQRRNVGWAPRLCECGEVES